MRKIFILLFMTIHLQNVNAQIPFVTYKPVYSEPDYSSRVNRELFEERNTYNYYNVTAPSKTIVEKETIKTIAFATENEIFYEIRVSAIGYSDGTVNLKVIGIKQNDSWKSCSCSLINWQDAYNATSNKDDKEVILNMMEFSEFFFNYKEKLYLVGLKE